MVSERLVQSGNSGDAIEEGDNRLRSLCIQARYETRSEINAQLSSTHAHIFESAHIGRSWSSGWLQLTCMFNLPTDKLGTMQTGTAPTEGDFMISPSSRHTGGVNVALIDGSVRFVSDEVAEKVWWAVGSRNDGRTESLP